MRITCPRSVVRSVATISLMCISLSSASALRSARSSSGVASSEESRIADQPGKTGPDLIQPSDLVSILKSPSSPKPLLIQVGFNVLYVQAHIPGSEYIGPTSSPDAVRRLHKRVEALPRTQPIVLYCGCCPWNECPNIKPAFKELADMGFKNVKLLYIARNFGEDWAGKNYPVAKGK